MKNTAPDLATASRWHSNVADILAKRHVQLRPKGALEDIWNALTQRAAPVTEAGKAVALTMDPEDVFVMRGCDGIPAAFALDHMLTLLPGGNDGAFSSDGFTLRQACRAAWSRFEAERDQANHFMRGFGCGSGAAWLTMKSCGEFQDADEMAVLANMVGKMYESMKGKIRVLKPSKAEYEVDGVTTGGDLQKLLPHELLKLGHPVTADLAAMRILQKRAEQVQMRGWEFGNRGPMVILKDESGSMDDRWSQTGNPVGRHTWATACTLAMVRVAHEQDRIARVVHFSTGTMAQELPPGDQGEMLKLARTFLNGGTDIPTAMRRGLEQIGDLEKSGHRGADLVLVTDGECFAFEEQNEIIDEMERKGIDLWTVGIQLSQEDVWMRGRNGKPMPHPLRTRSKLYVHVDGLNEKAIEGLEQACLGNEARDRYRMKYA